VTVIVERIQELPPDGLAELVAESEQAGWKFLRRLIEEWATGANRFTGPHEALFVARAGQRVVGVCGLNVDPYAGDQRAGRVRRLYVLSMYRRRGVGEQLVAAVIAAARGAFDSLRLRTDNAEAARCYEKLGFRRCARADCTHVLELEGSAHQGHSL
jgi:ribosomal protein S18 acetylase RimI-like enzyme